MIANERGDKMKEKITAEKLFEIDAAVVMPELKEIMVNNEKGWMFPKPNPEYKYMAIIREDAGTFAIASKDGKEWVLCIGAIKNGKKLDVMKMRDTLKWEY